MASTPPGPAPGVRCRRGVSYPQYEAALPAGAAGGRGRNGVDRICDNAINGAILSGRILISLLRRFREYAAILVGINVAILVIASWTPSEAMVRTEALSGWAEHAIAYLASGFSTTVLLKGRLSPLHIAVGLACLAALLEAGQLFAPGRQAKLSDFAVSAIAGVAGIVLGSLFAALESRVAGGQPGRRSGPTLP